jgi:hypothetical protein
MIPYLKKKKRNPTQKRIGREAQVVECLPSKHETLSSNPNIVKKKKKKKTLGWGCSSGSMLA